MPYFVFRIDPTKELHYLGQFSQYRDAKTKVRTLRSQEATTNGTVRLIHASTQIEAEKLLLMPREAPVEGDD